MEKVSRVVTLIKDKFNDGSVKFFFLLVTTPSGAPDTQDVKDYESNLNFVEHTKVLKDEKADGVKALWGPDAKVKSTMVLSPGFKISSTAFDVDETEAAIEKAMKE